MVPAGGALICLLKSNNSTKRRSEKRFSALYSPSNSLSGGYKFDFEIKKFIEFGDASPYVVII